MDFGISTRCFGTTALTVDLLERLRREDFSTIELYGVMPSFDYRNRSFLRGVARWFGEVGLTPPSLHLPTERPGEDLLAPGPIERQRALDELKRCLELCDLMPLGFVVLHLGAQGQAFSPVLFDHGYKAIATIQSFAGVRILLETLANDIATFERIREFRDAAQIGNVGICYDTGHGEWESRPDAIHLNDNNGDDDEHLWPFEGKRNWPALVEQIVLSDFDGPLILEGRDERFDKARDSGNRLRDLLDEARSSIDEFRLKHRLPAPRQKDEE
ncbi:MAG TPA: sugar phosphate isomerase/epimerase family protein [Terriglobia bacterium]|nr:sugar phosphate isomerase/epimerase family protein [Terriglobia bacterium]